MKILLAIDGSPSSKKAIAEVARQPWPAQSEVHVITVEVPVVGSLIPEGIPGFEDLVQKQKGLSQQILEEATQVLKANACDLKISTSIFEGRPKDIIVAEAERLAADLIVVGSHGYGPIRSYFLGSISHYLVNNAPCSVLVVR